MPATTELRVRYAETDMMGVAYHGSFLPWFEIGRTEALRDNGILLAGPHAIGYQFVVSELEIRYRKAALADDLVHVESSIVELRGASSRWQQRVLRARDVPEVKAVEAIKAAFGSDWRSAAC